MSRLLLTPSNLLAISSAPTTPTLRVGDVYFDTTSNLVKIYNGSAWIGISLVEQVNFSNTGTLTVSPGTHRAYTEIAYTVSTIRANVGTAPVGASIIVDVNKNGTTIFTTQANRPTIVASSNTSGVAAAPDITTFAAGDYLSVDVDQIGSTTPGADLTVTIRLQVA